MKHHVALIIFLLLNYYGLAQVFKLSPNSEISVLTIGPGEHLNDKFGHSAYRVKDTNNAIDVVYGYGNYDFDTPNFYLKFAQGKLLYTMSRNRFADIVNHYSKVNRTIKEQELQLTIEEKQRLFQFLETNYKPQNRKYLYDFFYDNCATKIRDVVQKGLRKSITFNTPKNFEAKTFRQLIHNYVGLNSWGSFGIDLALGSVIDQKATPSQHMFLPDNIYNFFSVASKENDEPLVKKSRVIYQKIELEKADHFFMSPLFIFCLLSLFIIYTTYKDYKAKTRSKWLDVALFLITGIVGCLMLWLWMCTNHTATAFNYNVLWAFPFNLILVYALTKNSLKNWIKGYFKFLILMLCLMLLHWIVGIQIFSIALIPLILAIILRYLFLINTFKHT